MVQFEVRPAARAPAKPPSWRIFVLPPWRPMIAQLTKAVAPRPLGRYGVHSRKRAAILFLYSDHVHFMMLAGIQDHVPKELSLGGVNQRMRGKDGGKGSKGRPEPKRSRSRPPSDRSRSYRECCYRWLSSPAKLSFVAAQQELLRLVRTQFFGSMIRLLRSGDLGCSNFDTPSVGHRRRSQRSRNRDNGCPSGMYPEAEGRRRSNFGASSTLPLSSRSGFLPPPQSRW